MRLLLHRYGHFDRRPFGPVCWPHHDLLWVHDGAVSLTWNEGHGTAILNAPDGVLIPPGTVFRGCAVGRWSRASVCHFEQEMMSDAPVLRCEPASRADVGAAIRYALRLAQDAEGQVRRRERLLLTILDAFSPAPAPPDAPPQDPALASAWIWAEANLGRVRTVADIAIAANLSESRFRARHQAMTGTGAGRALRTLRLAAAERLLLTTDLPIADIAVAVGYGRPESLTDAFAATRGASPRTWRARFRFA